MHVVDGQAVDGKTADDGRTGGSRQPAGDPRRVRAHARAHRHSARVRTLRRVLPVVAGGAVLGLAAWLFNPFAAIAPGVSVGPVTVAGTKVRMENPKLSGFRQGSRAYEVTATAALQDMRKPSQIELEAMRGHIATDDQGGIARLQAATGLFDTAREALDLKTDIRIWTDKGEEALLSSAAIAFKAGSVTSRESVTVNLPSGQVVADGLDVVDSGRVISFIGNVHTVFHDDKPGKAKDAKDGVAKDGVGKDGVAKDAPIGPAPRVLTSSAEPTDGRP